MAVPVGWVARMEAPVPEAVQIGLHGDREPGAHLDVAHDAQICDDPVVPGVAILVPVNSTFRAQVLQQVLNGGAGHFPAWKRALQSSSRPCVRRVKICISVGCPIAATTSRLVRGVKNVAQARSAGKSRLLRVAAVCAGGRLPGSGAVIPTGRLRGARRGSVF
eukprot:547976-Pyramimonas_sp.AAC.1